MLDIASNNSLSVIHLYLLSKKTYHIPRVKSIELSRTLHCLCSEILGYGRLFKILKDGHESKPDKAADATVHQESAYL